MALLQTLILFNTDGELFFQHFFKGYSRQTFDDKLQQEARQGISSVLEQSIHLTISLTGIFSPGQEERSIYLYKRVLVRFLPRFESIYSQALKTISPPNIPQFLLKDPTFNSLFNDLIFDVLKV